MRTRISLAVIISLVLILGAVWYRFWPMNQKTSGIVAVTNTANNTESEISDSSSQQDTSVANLQDASISKTEQLGRNMITDYASLAATGKATDQSVKDLANQYVDMIPSINSPIIVKIEEIKSVANTKDNFKKYSDDQSIILNEYAKNIIAADSGGNYGSPSPSLYKMTDGIGNAYKEAAIKLKALSTPTALVNDHLKLINLYMASAEAMLSVSKADTDSSSSFAGIITMKNNLDEETLVINKINKTLSLNGI